MDLEPQRMRIGRHFAQGLKLGIAFIETTFGMGVAIGTGVQFDHLGPDARGGFDLLSISGDENRYSAPRLAQGRNIMRQTVFIARDFQPAFCGAFFAFFRNDTDRMWFVTQRDSLHLVGRGHFKVQRHGQDLHQPINIRVRNVPAVFAQMRRDAIRPCLFGQLGRPQRVRIRPTSCIPHRGDMVDVHTQTQFSQRLHRLLLHSFARPRGADPSPVFCCRQPPDALFSSGQQVLPSEPPCGASDRPGSAAR